MIHYLYRQKSKKISTKPLNILLADDDFDDCIFFKKALEEFYEKYGYYPKSTGFNGLYSSYGASGANWIPDLVPQYILSLPRDPRMNSDPANQYLYASDGKDYKIIAHNPEDCGAVKQLHPELIDPQRDCHAYGYWTPLAARW